MVKRIDPATLGSPGATEEDLARFVERDFQIRSGACPNGCGLLNDTEWGQECPKCHFSCNIQAERGGAH